MESKASMTTKQRRFPFARELRERVSDIKVLLMFGPFPGRHKYRSDRLSRELAMLESWQDRSRRPPAK
jgi:hypothetical protein